MNKYHIGIRLKGFSKSFFKIQKDKTNNNESNYVPHITLLRPFYTENERELIEIFNKTLSQYEDPIKFTIKKINYFNNDKKIIKAEIEKNPEIENIIHSLESNLEKIIYFASEKQGNEINLHTTISEDNNLLLLDKLDHEILPIEQYLLRIYLLKHYENKKLILREYDLYLKKSLIREEALNKELFKETIKEFTKRTGLIPTLNGFISK